MTINFPYNLNIDNQYIGREFFLECTMIGNNEKTIALYVSNITTIDGKKILFKLPYNKIFHITLAHKNIGDAKLSNNIINWKPIGKILVKGKINVFHLNKRLIKNM